MFGRRHVGTPICSRCYPAIAKSRILCLTMIRPSRAKLRACLAPIQTASTSIAWTTIHALHQGAMPFTLVPVTSAPSFPPLVRALYAAQADPPVGAIQLFTPVLGSGPTALNDSIQEATGRLWFNHACDRGATWMSAVDSDGTGELVAACKWNVVEALPLSPPPSQAPAVTEGKSPTQRSRPMFDPFWLPEGSELRRYAQLVLMQLVGLQSGSGKKHICMALIYFFSLSFHLCAQSVLCFKVYSCLWNSDSDHVYASDSSAQRSGDYTSKGGYYGCGSLASRVLVAGDADGEAAIPTTWVSGGEGGFGGAGCG